MQMANAVKTSYEQNGYCIFEQPVLEPELLAAALAGMNMIREGGTDTGTLPHHYHWKPGDDPSALCKIDGPQAASRAIAELISSTEVGECAAAATGAQMVQAWAVQALYKPPTSDGTVALTNVGWHQDWNYWNKTWEDPSELLTAWVALADVAEDSGPMKFVQSSHQWRDVGGGDFWNQQLVPDGFSIPEGQQWCEVPAVMQAGGLSLHHKFTLHGSGPNISNAPRCSIAIHLRTEKSRPIDGGRAFHAEFIDDPGICPIIYGEKVESAFS